jgi:hypothetical protein
MFATGTVPCLYPYVAKHEPPRTAREKSVHAHSEALRRRFALQRQSDHFHVRCAIDEQTRQRADDRCFTINAARIAQNPLVSSVDGHVAPYDGNGATYVIEDDRVHQHTSHRVVDARLHQDRAAVVNVSQFERKGQRPNGAIWRESTHAVVRTILRNKHRVAQHTVDAVAVAVDAVARFIGRHGWATVAHGWRRIGGSRIGYRTPKAVAFAVALTSVVLKTTFVRGGASRSEQRERQREKWERRASHEQRPQFYSIPTAVV